jgi:hypothetical protein
MVSMVELASQSLMLRDRQNLSQWADGTARCGGGNLRCKGLGGEHGVGCGSHCVGMLGFEVLLTAIFRNPDAMRVG